MATETVNAGNCILRERAQILWKVETMIGCFGNMCLEFIDGEQYSMTHSLSLSLSLSHVPTNRHIEASLS